VAAVRVVPPSTLEVHDATQATEARRIARRLAAQMELPGDAIGRAELVATEAATNLVKHARGGTMLMRTSAHEDLAAVDILAIDRGPGMANLGECLRDGYSSTGTQGEGLGAIARQSTFFDAYSRPGAGTVLFVRIAATRTSPPARDARGQGLIADGFSIQKRGEPDCGDAWTAEAANGVTRILVADGLGHGALAADASREAVSVFHASAGVPPVEAIDRIHRALMKTRGAAVAVASIEAEKGVLRYAGAGNIAATIEGNGAARHLVSVHGTAGHQIRRPQEFSYPWTPEAILVMHSDGLSGHWTLGAYPGLAQRHPAVIAAVLLRDFSRGRDDATVVVVKAMR
jgi:anti-sigma regulatory factor (Ser/Thr protein kinase)